MTDFTTHPTLDQQPCRYGPLRFFRHDRFIGRSLALYGEWGQFEIDWLTTMLRPGDTVVDAGANVGSHTLPFAQAVGPTGRVHAFEPQASVAEVLQANMASNGAAQVVVHQAALGAASGRIVVPRLASDRPINLGGLTLGGFGPGEGDDVALTTLDELALPDCRLIKIDVEGMEGEVLAGGVGTLARCRPILYVENDRPDKMVALQAAIAGHGYRMWWHVATFYNAGNFRGARKNVFPDLFGLNLLCLPEGSEIRPETHPCYRPHGPQPGAGGWTAAAFGLPIEGGERVIPVAAR
jgi:FkbM family methyltransferase